MSTIAPRRMPSSSPDRSRRSVSRSPFMRSSTGITRSLHTMVESAMVSTITMPVAADSPPMNTSSASHGCLLRHRQRQHEGVGVHGAAREMQQAAEGDRQHEHVDRQQVEREQPDRLVEVALVHVLDHRHLELARQEHDRDHRQERERSPARVVAGRAPERQQRIELRHLRGAVEDVAEAVVHPEGDEQPDGEEGEQLDQRLERDRRDHALVALGRVEVAGAEQDGEGGEQHRDVERVVPEEQRARSACRGIATSGYCRTIVKVLEIAFSCSAM